MSRHPCLRLGLQVPADAVAFSSTRANLALTFPFRIPAKIPGRLLKQTAGVSRVESNIHSFQIFYPRHESRPRFILMIKKQTPFSHVFRFYRRAPSSKPTPPFYIKAFRFRKRTHTVEGVWGITSRDKSNLLKFSKVVETQSQALVLRNHLEAVYAFFGNGYLVRSSVKSPKFVELRCSTATESALTMVPAPADSEQRATDPCPRRFRGSRPLQHRQRSHQRTHHRLQ